NEYAVETAASRRAHPRFELSQFQKTAAVKRQTLDLAAADQTRDLVAVVSDLRRGAVNSDGFFCFPYTQGEVRRRSCSRFHLCRTHDRLEAQSFGVHVILSRQERGEAVMALRGRGR